MDPMMGAIAAMRKTGGNSGAEETRWVCLSMYSFDGSHSASHRLGGVKAVGRQLIDCVVAPCSTLIVTLVFICLFCILISCATSRP